MKFFKQMSLVAISSLSFTAQTNALDDPKFSINANNNQKGTLSMEQLYIDGVKSFENLKIEFDFSNSTFVILAATPVDNSIPPQAIETLDAGGLSVGLRGCVSKNRTVTCHLLLTSNEFDRTIRFCGDGSFGGSCRESTAFDNVGNQYSPSKVTIASAEGELSLDQKLIADVTTEATITFDNISTRAINFSQLDLGFGFDGDGQRAKFSNVSF